MGKLYIVQVEGVDKTGKTRVAHMLEYELNRVLPEFGWKAIVEHEPIRPPPEEIRGFFLHPETKEEKQILYRQLDWFIKDRQEHIRRLQEKYADENVVVIMDRYMLSTLVYQVLSLGTTRALLKFWWGHRRLPKPDYTILVSPKLFVEHVLEFKEVYKAIRSKHDPDPELIPELLNRYFKMYGLLYEQYGMLFSLVDRRMFLKDGVIWIPIDKESVRMQATSIMNRLLFR